MRPGADSSSPKASPVGGVFAINLAGYWIALLYKLNELASSGPGRVGAPTPPSNIITSPGGEQIQIAANTTLVKGFNSMQSSA